MGDRARVPGKFPDDVFPSFQKDDDDAPDACDDDRRRAFDVVGRIVVDIKIRQKSSS